MRNSILFTLLLLSHLLFTSSAELVKGNEDAIRSSKTKLFVFGDSYADTGNWNKVAGCWKVPYGITNPGKPTGRFSDGKILTDFVASYLRITSPIPYEQWKVMSGSSKANASRFGMNFAYGGTGVFDTDISKPNMTSQISILDRLIKQDKVYSDLDLKSSIALVAIGGNDYSNFLKSATNMSVPEFAKTIVKQLVTNIERIHSLGVQKIAVTSLEPLGCLPVSTFALGYENCTQGFNEAARRHNHLLQLGLEQLSNESNGLKFSILDLYNSFQSALQLKPSPPGTLQGRSPLKPCCEGIKSDYECGSVEGGVAKYSVCERPKAAFFWDMVHPTQHGWHHVYKAIQPALRSLLES